MGVRGNPWAIAKQLAKRVSHTCPIVSNKDLKNEIIKRTIDLGVSLKEVCILADVSYAVFEEKYIELAEPKSDYILRADEIIRVADVIGIKVRITIIKQSLNKVDIKKIIKGIPKDERKKNKKLD